jgi:hypothetical protein
MDSEPAGKMLAATTSCSMRCASQAVDVAGLTTTGTPESSAGAAFSQSPQAGKLKALIESARPVVGTSKCWLWNDSSLLSGV